MYTFFGDQASKFESNLWASLAGKIIITTDKIFRFHTKLLYGFSEYIAPVILITFTILLKKVYIGCSDFKTLRILSLMVDLMESSVFFSHLLEPSTPHAPCPSCSWPVWPLRPFNQTCSFQAATEQNKSFQTLLWWIHVWTVLHMGM